MQIQQHVNLGINYTEIGKQWDKSQYLISQVKMLFFSLPSWLSLWSTHPLQPQKPTRRHKLDCSKIHTGNDQSHLLLTALRLFTKSLHQLSASYVTGSSSLFPMRHETPASPTTLFFPYPIPKPLRLQVTFQDFIPILAQTHCVTTTLNLTLGIYSPSANSAPHHL